MPFKSTLVRYRFADGREVQWSQPLHEAADTLLVVLSELNTVTVDGTQLRLHLLKVKEGADK